MKKTKPILTKPEQMLVAHAMRLLFMTMNRDGGTQGKILQAKGVIRATKDSCADRAELLIAVRGYVEDKLDICAGCLNMGWILSTVDGSDHCKDGTLAIQKCDECEDKPWGFKNDLIAAQRSGLRFKDNGYHCVVLAKDVPKWLKNH